MYCIHACHGHPKHEFKCHHGKWTIDEAQLTCNSGDRPGNNTGNASNDNVLLGDHFGAKKLERPVRHPLGRGKRIHDQVRHYGYEVVMTEKRPYKNEDTSVKDIVSDVKQKEKSDSMKPAVLTLPKSLLYTVAERPSHLYVAPHEIANHSAHIKVVKPRPIIDIPQKAPGSEGPVQSSEDTAAEESSGEEDTSGETADDHDDHPLSISYHLITKEEAEADQDKKPYIPAEVTSQDNPSATTTAIPLKENYRKTTLRAQGLPKINALTRFTSGHQKPHVFSYQAFNNIPIVYNSHGTSGPLSEAHRTKFFQFGKHLASPQAAPFSQTTRVPYSPRTSSYAPPTHHTPRVGPKIHFSEEDDDSEVSTLAVHPHSTPKPIPQRPSKGPVAFSLPYSYPYPVKVTTIKPPLREHVSSLPVTTQHRQFYTSPTVHVTALPKQTKATTAAVRFVTATTSRAPAKAHTFGTTGPPVSPILYRLTASSGFDDLLSSNITRHTDVKDIADTSIPHSITSIHNASSEVIEVKKPPKKPSSEHQSITGSDGRISGSGEDAKVKIGYKLINPKHVGFTEAPRTKYPSSKHRNAAVSPKSKEKTPSSSFGGPVKYKLLKPPLPSADSKVEPGHIVQLPIWPQTSSDGNRDNPFLRKHSGNDFSLYTLKPPRMANFANLSPTGTTTTATTTATSSASTSITVRENSTDVPKNVRKEEALYDVLYRNAIDGVDFNEKNHDKSSGDGGDASPLQEPSQAHVNTAARLKQSKHTERSTPEKLMQFGKEPTAFSGDTRYIGFSNNRYVRYPANDEALVKLAKKKYSQEQKKIVFKEDRREKSFEDDTSDEVQEILPFHKTPDGLDWKPKVPTVVNDTKTRPTCLHPASVPNGRLHCLGRKVIGNRYREGARCTLSCDPGYTTAGKETAICGASGAWISASPLQCQETIAMVIGGWNIRSSVLSHVELYDPREDSQCHRVRIAPIPSPRRGMVAAWTGGKVLVCGGVNETNSINKCWAYDPVQNVWEPLPRGTVVERHFAGTIKLRGTLHVLGGRDGRIKPMALGTVETFDANEGIWREHPELSLSQERAYHCVTKMGDDTAVLTGGYSYNAVLGIAESYNVSLRNGWREVGAGGNLNHPRYLHGCSPVQLPNKRGSGRHGVLVAGGYSDDYLRSTEVYDPVSDTWQEAAPLPLPRQGSQMPYLAGRPTIMGGFFNMTEFPTDVLQFDSDANRWVLMQKGLEVPRRYFAVAEVPKGLFKC